MDPCGRPRSFRMVESGTNWGEEPVGLLAAARKILSNDDVEFVASLDQLESDVAGPWTLRDALVVASGCDRKAGPFAYWEHREIGAAMNQAWDRLGAHVDGSSVQGWSRAKGRTKADVLGALDQALADGDVAVATELTMRPWCTTKLIRTCRIPFVPLAALAHSWSARGGSLGDLLGHFEIDALTDPWQILDRAEPTIRDVPAPPDTSELADYLRGRMNESEPEIYSPARLLVQLEPGLTLDGLRDLLPLRPAGR